MPKAIIVTGLPGVGKTTLVRGLAERLGSRAAGFLTDEVRVGGRREGFDLVLWPARTRVPLARRETGAVPGPGGRPRVGLYVVFLEGLETVGVPALRAAAADPAVGVVLVDEIGRMELLSQAFREAASDLFAGPKLVLATARLGPDSLVDALKSRPGVETFVLTPGNRDRVLVDLAARLAFLARPG